MRVFAYCHEGMGVGHLRRTMTICDTLVRRYPSLTCKIATGSPYHSLFDSGPRVGWFKLPTITKHTDGTYLPTNSGLTIDPVINVRSRLLLQAVQKSEPNLVLVDKAPVGVCGELKKTLQWLKINRPKTRIIFGMRDIEDEPSATIAQWTALDAEFSLASHYDEIWVYGMRELFDVAESYRLSPVVRDKLRYLGYVCRPIHADASPDPSGLKDVVVTVGGGTDGTMLLEMYLSQSARRLAEAGFRSILVAGPDLPSEDAERLAGLASKSESVTWLKTDRHMTSRLRNARLIVSMGGYNTLCETVSLGRSAVVIPRTAPRREQYIRADIWQSRGVVTMLDPADLSASVLADRILECAVNIKSVDPSAIDFGGLGRIADRIGELSERSRAHEVAVSMQ